MIRNGWLSGNIRFEFQSFLVFLWARSRIAGCLLLVNWENNDFYLYTVLSVHLTRLTKAHKIMPEEPVCIRKETVPSLFLFFLSAFLVFVVFVPCRLCINVAITEEQM
jgi:hypothetical protein